MKLFPRMIHSISKQLLCCTPKPRFNPNQQRRLWKKFFCGILLTIDYGVIIAALFTVDFIWTTLIPLQSLLLGGFNLPETYRYMIIPLIYLGFLLYERIYFKLLPLWKRMERFFRVCLFSTFLNITLIFLLKQPQNIMIIFLFAHGFLSFLYLLACHYCVNRLLLAFPGWRKPVIVVGTTHSANLLAQSIANETHMVYRVIGIIPEEAQFPSGSTFPVLGDFNTLEETITSYCIEEVFIALPGLGAKKSISLINRIQPLVKSISVIPDLFDIPVGNMKLETLPNQKTVILKIRNKLTNRWNLIYKRSFDVFCGSFLLTLTIPFMLLIIIMIKLDSPGPVFFIDKRIGRNKKEFNCYKFRTMQLNNEEILNHFLQTNLKARNEWEQFAKLKLFDPRLTRLGRILRRFSLDELPQLINVLKGEMSLVGPRPYLPREQEQMGRFIHIIAETTPGITGLWQVSGRNEVDFQERLVMDSWYVRNWSFWLDISLLVNTFKILFERKGAY